VAIVADASAAAEVDRRAGDGGQGGVRIANAELARDLGQARPKSEGTQRPVAGRGVLDEEEEALRVGSHRARDVQDQEQRPQLGARSPPGPLERLARRAKRRTDHRPVVVGGVRPSDGAPATGATARSAGRDLPQDPPCAGEVLGGVLGEVAPSQELLRAPSGRPCGARHGLGRLGRLGPGALRGERIRWPAGWADDPLLLGDRRVNGLEDRLLRAGGTEDRPERVMERHGRDDCGALPGPEHLAGAEGDARRTKPGGQADDPLVRRRRGSTHRERARRPRAP
jgi:hypothetical protein